ncbi:hypothetical protein [Corynebacterium parakroppenstedtii]|uniref:Uncharacterized protein n=1 Tax=Corynebacterium parakroppenstedtii TaxID=2828363 RepID=A0ABS9HMK8_9CORY|nr:hypothetical protein [Corynebacterium parakroppenstedtii]KXB49255.1 hypothetical protein HMPREF1861_02019 [Corynebacterium kroppenstedtii]MCF6774085.1 hypothetical protein [Corynebacterium parakroppenstedtii]MCF7183454.1 hypothetical protein [Corynebacterium parakroppenstedtii]MCF8701364.1 hypothetical protein [Corynebacterium parakroppenstedtii]
MEVNGFSSLGRARRLRNVSRETFTPSQLGGEQMATPSADAGHVERLGRGE